MRLTTKGRYAVMAMVNIAQNKLNIPLTIAKIAANQNIDIAYLEKIFNALRKQGLVSSVKGPGGGYILADSSNNIYIDKIMSAVDEEMIMTRCNMNYELCSINGKKCLTHDLWVGLQDQIHSYLSSISLADICNQNIEQYA